jgi:hypothetical protein
MENMAQYRCYFLDSSGGNSATETVECFGDREAVDIARNMLQQRSHHYGIELWKGSRRLHHEVRIPVPAFVIRSLQQIR